MTNEKTLPYDFDLWHDIKTEERLHEEIHYACNKVRSLFELCEYYGIKFDDHGIVVNPVDE